jgi:hypothetical protein
MSSKPLGGWLTELFTVKFVLKVTPDETGSAL